MRQGIAVNPQIVPSKANQTRWCLSRPGRMDRSWFLTRQRFPPCSRALILYQSWFSLSSYSFWRFRYLTRRDIVSAIEPRSPKWQNNYWLFAYRRPSETSNWGNGTVVEIEQDQELFEQFNKKERYNEKDRFKGKFRSLRFGLHLSLYLVYSRLPVLRHR